VFAQVFSQIVDPIAKEKVMKKKRSQRHCHVTLSCLLWVVHLFTNKSYRQSKKGDLSKKWSSLFGS